MKINIISASYDHYTMDRRQILKSLPLTLAGLALSPSVKTLWEELRTEVPEGLFNATDMEDISAICEVIIPETSTPGAIAAGVPAFVSAAIPKIEGEDAAAKFQSQFATFKDTCREKTGKRFSELDDSGQQSFLAEMADANDPFFITMRRWTVVGFFTSEVGMTQALHYDPIPGKIEPCVEVTPDTKADAQYF